MSNFSSNSLTREFGLKLPIVQGPMGAIAGPALVAAVASAGGMGLLPIWTQNSEAALRDIDETWAMSNGAFGVNIRADLDQIELIQAALDRGVSIVHLFWGDPQTSVRHIRAADAVGVKILVTVGDADAAKRALDAGVDGLVAQGIEAGGHVLGETPLEILLPAVVDIAQSVPVVAAGGLADAHDVARVMAAGAAGALLGTRFVATEESMAHDDYKQALSEAGADSTERSVCFVDGWEDAPHRTLKNATLAAWNAARQPASGSRPGENDVVLKLNDIPFKRYSVMPPIRGMTGEIRAGALYAGTGVAKIQGHPSVATVINELVSLL